MYDVYVSVGDPFVARTNAMVERITKPGVAQPNTITGGPGRYGDQLERSAILLYLGLTDAEVSELRTRVMYTAAAYDQEAYGFAVIPADSALSFVPQGTKDRTTRGSANV